MICGKCGSGGFVTWPGCGKETVPQDSIAQVNDAAIKDGWLLVYTPHGSVEALVCPACRPEFEKGRVANAIVQTRQDF